jgi:predicted nucleotidyltransferase
VSDHTDDLPQEIAAILDEFIAAVKRISHGNLKAAVLFGSAAEGRLRPGSDVNLILVFGEMRLAELDGMRDSFRFAHAAIALNTLFIEESEVAIAAQAFAVKFSDIRVRHRVLYGEDVFAGVDIDREAIIQRLKQVLINLTLRFRERYALGGGREEQLARLIADSSGPLRACAAAILELEGVPAASPKEALQILVQRLPEGDWAALLVNLAAARSDLLAREALSATSAGLLELLRAMYRHVSGIRVGGER